MTCEHTKTHQEADYLGPGRIYIVDVCDGCGEVIPLSGRWLAPHPENPLR